ncbi:hypothetical protein [Celeribacter indicus]|nr:hypothetical protein [Celeribacter indicus]
MSSVGDEDAGEDRMIVAFRQFDRAILVIDRAIERIVADDPDVAFVLPKSFKELKAALETAQVERRRLDELRRKDGELQRGEIDFDAARAEVLDRLARLKAAGGAG